MQMMVRLVDLSVFQMMNVNFDIVKLFIYFLFKVSYQKGSNWATLYSMVIGPLQPFTVIRYSRSLTYFFL